jgi:hypothetical protein
MLPYAFYHKEKFNTTKKELSWTVNSGEAFVARKSRLSLPSGEVI